MNALEGPNALNYTLWTYVPDNTHQEGDLWYVFCRRLHHHTLTIRNGEDLSIWSKDDMELPAKESTGTNNNLQGNRSSGSDVSIASSSTLTPSPAYTPEGIRSGSGVTAALITDGARAVGAVCRPFPVATVGEIKHADFNIGSSTFKLSVKVRPEDFVSERISTEIYLPFVHYAKSLDNSKSYHDDTKAQQGLELDIDIKTTAGTTSIQGQYLTWTYPKSTREEVYTIEVSRKGGAIERDVAYSVTSGSWSDVCGGCTIA